MWSRAAGDYETCAVALLMWMHAETSRGAMPTVQCTRACRDSLTLHSGSRLKPWAHILQEAVKSALNKASLGYKLEPEHTSSLLVLLDRPEASW